ncbi:MAG: hypothetical protein GXY33_10810 [Phycisphaerae bacterium]|nr:hypothetical protein [Phycisphaerae bacterium]
MTLFRVVVMIVGLAAIAAGSVHLRWSNANYAYRIQQEYDRYLELKNVKYPQKRLELWQMQSPRFLMEQLDRWDFGLQGWTLPDPNAPSSGTTPKPTSPAEHD